MHASWKPIHEFYKPLRIPKSTRGQALSTADEAKLLTILGSKKRWRIAYLCTVVSFNTTCGPAELLRIKLRDLNLDSDPPTVHIRGEVKNQYRERVIPLNEYALKVFQLLLKRANKLGATRGDHFLLPHRADEDGGTADLTRPMGSWRKAWEQARIAAGMPHLRMYDARHHAITTMLEKEDVPERAVIEVAGHVSNAMLKRYSHIRMATKKQAVDALVNPKKPKVREAAPVPPKPGPKPVERPSPGRLAPSVSCRFVEKSR